MSTDSAEHSWRMMRTLLFDLHDTRADVAEKLDMSFVRAKALLKLMGGPLTMRELATRLATDPPYVSVVVDDLARRGLVERSTHTDDRRVKVVSLTPAGIEAAAVGDAIQNQPPEVFQRLSSEDLANLERILTRLVDPA